MNELDAKINQCENDIKKLQDNLIQLKKEKKDAEEPKWLIAKGYYHSSPRAIINLKKLSASARHELAQELLSKSEDSDKQIITLCLSDGSIRGNYSYKDLLEEYETIRPLDQLC